MTPPRRRGGAEHHDSSLRARHPLPVELRPPHRVRRRVLRLPVGASLSRDVLTRFKKKASSTHRARPGATSALPGRGEDERAMITKFSAARATRRTSHTSPARTERRSGLDGTPIIRRSVGSVGDEEGGHVTDLRLALITRAPSARTTAAPPRVAESSSRRGWRSLHAPPSAPGRRASAASTPRRRAPARRGPPEARAEVLRSALVASARLGDRHPG